MCTPPLYGCFQFIIAGGEGVCCGLHRCKGGGPGPHHQRNVRRERRAALHPPAPGGPHPRNLHQLRGGIQPTIYAATLRFKQMTDFLRGQTRRGICAS